MRGEGSGVKGAEVRLEERGRLRAPPERVWEVLVRWEDQSRWMSDVAWIRVLGEEREVGARLEVRTRLFGLPLLTDRLVVTAWDPPWRLGVAHLGAVRGRGEWRLQPGEGGSTLLTWVEELHLPPGALGEVALRLYGPVQRWMLRRSLANLARMVEEGPPPPPGRRPRRRRGGSARSGRGRLAREVRRSTPSSGRPWPLPRPLRGGGPWPG